MHSHRRRGAIERAFRVSPDDDAPLRIEPHRLYTTREVAPFLGYSWAKSLLHALELGRTDVPMQPQKNGRWAIKGSNLLRYLERVG